MRKWIFTQLALLAFYLFSGHLAHAGDRVEFSNLGLVAEITWNEAPVRGARENKLRIEWFQQNNPNDRVALSQSSFRIQPWMPGHNHGGRPAALTPLHDSANVPIAGAFNVSRVFFSMMHGDYVLRIHVWDSAGRSQVIDLPLAL